jgi:OPA family glycerol-3-phosphate transporter-like MFS transporter
MFVVAALWVIISIKVNNEIKRDTEDTPADVTYEINNNEVIKEDNKISKLLVISGLSTVLVAVLIHGMLKDGIMTWVPTMITEKYSVKPSFAIFLTMVLPVINLFGAFIATLIFKRLKNHDEIKASLFFMAGPVIPFIVLIFIGKIPVVLSIALLAVITMSMTAFNHIYLTLVPQRFRGFGKTATITGIINSIVYIGSALSNYGFGMISEKLGWDYTICFWIIIAVIGTASCLMSLRKWREFIVSADKKQ